MLEILKFVKLRKNRNLYKGSVYESTSFFLHIMIYFYYEIKMFGKRDSKKEIKYEE